jgi:large subunit ribosomal protein L21
MYAIIENGGKQYKAVEGAYIEIDLLPEEVGKKKTFDKVLLLSTDDKVEVGTPYVKGVSVDTTIISHFKAPKVTVFKYRPKQRYRVKTGHRQRYSRVMVDSIAFPGKSEAAVKVKEENLLAEKAAPKKPAAKKTTTKKSASTKATASKSSTAKKSSSSAKKTSADKKK